MSYRHFSQIRLKTSPIYANWIVYIAITMVLNQIISIKYSLGIVEMSRYYQSTYHGSNDYRKYREQKIGKNNGESSVTSGIRKYPCDQGRKQYSPLPKRTANKQHMQTFGRDQSFGLDQRNSKHNYAAYTPRNTQILRNKQRQDTDIVGLSRNKTYHQNQSTLRDQSSTNRQGTTFKSYQPAALATYSPNVNLALRNNHKYQQPKQNQNYQQFQTYDLQGQVLSRQKYFGNAQRQFREKVSKTRTYNYSNKSINQTKQEKNTDRSIRYSRQPVSIQEKSPFVHRKERFNQKSQTQKQNVSPYQNRNQRIRQRLNVGQSNENKARSYLIRQNEPLYEQNRNIQPKHQQYTTKFKTDQVTPQKSQFTPKDQRNASQQRRKSLIQKSQILKQKLNRMNTPNTKTVLNHSQHLNKKTNYQKNSYVQNLTPKKYSALSTKVHLQNVERQEGKVTSRRLNFQSYAKDVQQQKQNDQVIRQDNLKNQKNTYFSTSSQGYSTEKHSSISYPNQISNEDPLKKISQLNQKINSRLQSILKNYG